MKTIINIDPLIKVKRVDLLDLPVIVLVNKFDEEAVENFSDDISKAHNTGQSIIPVVIDSYGGAVYSLLAMIAEIENSKLPVATIATGKAMSCGSILLSCGKQGHRYLDSNATVMIHDVSNMVEGKNEEIKASTKNTDRLNKIIFRLMAKNCGQERDYFLNLIHQKSHAGWYLSANETKKHGIVDHIGTPSFSVNVSVEMTLE